MGDVWLEAFLEAPVWRFVLPPGLCGARAAIGLIMPSVDKVGRYFPLTLGGVAGRPERRSRDDWAELAGRGRKTWAARRWMKMRRRND